MALADVPAVARLFQRILRKTRGPATSDLETYLADVFLGDERDCDIRSNVYVRDDGAVAGFMGVMPMRMSIDSKPVRAAVCGTFMVDGHVSDPFAGARLMRAFLAGPQDISLSETANEVSTAMWRKMNAAILAEHSLEWLRILRPAAFLAEMAARAVPGGRLLSFLGQPLDLLARHEKLANRWWRPVAATSAMPSEDADEEAIAALLVTLTERFAARPQWQQEELRRMLAHARRKALYGGMVRRIVRARNGRPVGLFVYYGDPRRIGRVIQLVAAPGQAGAVIDSMLAHADERGLAALRGRTMPDQLQAMLGGPFMFLHASSSIAHARDRTLLEPFLAGRAFFNGFAGESWSRLIGDRFD
ncbi:hypothetical protein [Arvimicrobium flavum]|uniref:hypothetical protein n=1 Tax=Arvimicrobium flavum TaxID=3393320 RepID=UPI00237BC64A|nr:hypothetical protein [Mesorhizobium shangrilense]